MDSDWRESTDGSGASTDMGSPGSNSRAEFSTSNEAWKLLCPQQPRIFLRKPDLKYNSMTPFVSRDRSSYDKEMSFAFPHFAINFQPHARWVAMANTVYPPVQTVINRLYLTPISICGFDSVRTFTIVPRKFGKAPFAHDSVLG
jgi:hypothetical protein